jgi:hypothetical protein
VDDLRNLDAGVLREAAPEVAMRGGARGSEGACPNARQQDDSPPERQR